MKILILGARWNIDDDNIAANPHALLLVILSLHLHYKSLKLCIRVIHSWTELIATMVLVI